MPVILIMIVGMILSVPLISKLLEQHPNTLRIMKLCALCAYLMVNVHHTLTSRSPTQDVAVDLRPFWSYTRNANGYIEQKAQIILNIFLYIPMGYLLPFTFPRLKAQHVILIGCLASILTETTQYIFRLGLCEFDDVFHNTLGTVIGFGAYWGMKKIIGYWEQCILTQKNGRS